MYLKLIPFCEYFFLQLPQDQFFSQNKKFKHKKIFQNLKEMHNLKLLLLIKRAITIHGIMENGEVLDAFET
jgi:hypothetical protein